jgi:hypothetical protein
MIKTAVEFLAGAMMGLFLFTTASRPVLGHIQALIQWARGGCFLGGKTAGASSLLLTFI